MRAVSACVCRLQSVLMYLPAFICPPLSACSIVLLSVHLFFNATVWFLLRSPTVIQCADVGVSLVSCCLSLYQLDWSRLLYFSSLSRFSYFSSLLNYSFTFFFLISVISHPFFPSVSPYPPTLASRSLIPSGFKRNC